MSKSITRGAAVAAFLINTALASPVAAIEPPEPNAPDWGAANSIYSIGACDAGIREVAGAGNVTYQALNCVRVEPTGSVNSSNVGFPVHLPTGALLTAIRVNYFDDYVGSDPSVETLATPHTVANAGGSYAILAFLSRSGATLTALYGFEISYHLQVSPAPAVATFPNDVPTSHPFFRFIEAMAASGLTGGCAAGSFCPDNPVTRGQLAVFLSVALGLHFPN